MFGIISEWHGQAVGVSVRSSRTVWGGGVSAWNIMCCVMVLQQNSLQNTRRLLLLLVCRYVVCKRKIETNAICWFGCEQNQWELFLATLWNNNYYYFSNRLLSTRYFFVLFFSSIICLCRVLERSRIVMKHSCIVRCHLSCLRVPFFFFISVFEIHTIFSHNKKLQAKREYQSITSEERCFLFSCERCAFFTALLMVHCQWLFAASFRCSCEYSQPFAVSIVIPLTSNAILIKAAILFDAKCVF